MLEAGEVRTSELGSPQGGVISPLLANIYLDYLDDEWQRRYSQLGRLVRYADDFVVLCKTESQAKAARRAIEEILGALQLELHPEKTRIVELGLGKEGFVFLGCYLRIVRSRFEGKTYLFRWPSPRAMNPRGPALATSASISLFDTGCATSAALDGLRPHPVTSR